MPQILWQKGEVPSDFLKAYEQRMILLYPRDGVGPPKCFTSGEVKESKKEVHPKMKPELFRNMYKHLSRKIQALHITRTCKGCNIYRKVIRTWSTKAGLCTGLYSRHFSKMGGWVSPHTHIKVEDPLDGVAYYYSGKVLDVMEFVDTQHKRHLIVTKLLKRR